MNGASTVHVTGPGSTWTNSNELRVGFAFIIDGAGSGLTGDGYESLGSGSSHDTGNRLLITDSGSVSSASGVIGVFHNGAPAVLGEAIVTGAGSTWTNSGNLTVEGGALTINDEALVHVGGTLTILDTVNLDGGTLRFNGYSRGASSTFNYQSGTIQLAGNRTVGPTTSLITDLFGATPVIPAGKGLIVEGTANIRGLVQADGGTFKSGQMNVGGGSGNNAGTLTIENGANVDIGGTMTIANFSTVQLSGGTLIASTIQRANGSSFSFTGGTLRVRTFQGNLLNQGGTLAPGNSPGILTIDGNYTQMATGVLEIEIGGTTPGTLHDQLQITGTATLDGRVDFPVVQVPGHPAYTPQVGHEFVFLEANGGVSGQFNSAFFGNLPASVAHEIQYNTNDVRLRFVAPEPIQFVSTEAIAQWTDSSDWRVDGDPTVPVSKSVVNVENLAGVPQQVVVAGANKSAHQLTVGDPATAIAVRVQGVNLSVAAGTVIENNGAIELENSAALVSQSVEVAGGGLLAGNGTIKANTLTISGGTISPGFSVGHLDIEGDYQQGAGGTLLIDVEGAATGQFDTIDVTGQVELAGTLRINAAGFVLTTPGEPIAILSAGSGIGEFDSVETIANNDIYFAPIYNPGAGAGGNVTGSGASVDCAAYVCVGGFYKGDMNRNGMFDPDDSENGMGDVRAFALALTNALGYRTHFGVSGSQSGNMDGFGGIDFDDIPLFSELMARNGGSAAAVAAAIAAALNPTIPEPSSAILILCGSFLVIGNRIRHESNRRRCKPSIRWAVVS